MRTPQQQQQAVLLLLLLIILLNLTVNQATPADFIKLQRFQVPARARANEPLQLRCEYELGAGQILHAMKLFKDDKEFYRFTPTSNHEGQRMAFQVAGCPVDLARSDQFGATISRLDRNSAGHYKCQVSVEGTFRSVSLERQLEVEPARKPADFSGAVAGRQRQRPAGRPSSPQLRHAHEQQPRPAEPEEARDPLASRASSAAGALGPRRPLAILCSLAAALAGLSLLP